MKNFVKTLTILTALILGAAPACGRTKDWALVALASAAAGIVVLVFMRGRWRRGK